MEAVRKRPAMYIGSTGEMGLHHLVYEVVDDSIDEALAGSATQFDVAIHLDNSITVIDNGRGIPVRHGDRRRNGSRPAEVVMTKLHASSKFNCQTLTKFPVACTGSASLCVNFLSEELHLEIWRDGFTWEQTYSKGEPDQQAEESGRRKETRNQSSLRCRTRRSSPPPNTTTTRWRSACASSRS